MPTLSMFYGIIIRMQSEKGGKHHVPHIHCLYGDDEIVMSLDGEVLEGSIPANKLKLIVAWISASRRRASGQLEAAQRRRRVLQD